ncbi:MAG: BACON domain-containing carbohydrate-binding protein, partial [Verrucomicrobiota bacterium]
MFYFGKIVRGATFVALLSIWFPFHATTASTINDDKIIINTLAESNGNIVLSWQPGTNTGPFQVFRKDSIANPWELIDEPITSFTMRVVKKGNIAFYRVVDFKTSGRSSSNDSKPPSAPGMLSALVTNSSKIIISWNPSTDPNPSSGLKGYNVYRNGGFLSFVSGTSVSDTNVIAATTYNYVVSAIDNAGNTNAASIAVTTCGYAISPGNISVSSVSTNGTVSLTAGTNCAWAVNIGATWITNTGPVSGAGNASLKYSVAANTSTNSRSGIITIVNQVFTITQAGAPPGTPSCSYSLSSGGGSFDSNAGSGSVGVFTGGSCTWTASSAANWITITLGASATGNGTVYYSLAANPSTNSRTSTINIINQVFTITQAGATPVTSCNYSLSSGGGSFDSNAGSGSVGVFTGGSCTWTASSAANWITITLGASATGNGTVYYSL